MNDHELFETTWRLKDAFLESIDEEYLKSLRENPKYIRLKKELSKKGNLSLLKRAKEELEKVERGEVDDNEMAESEFKMIALLDAIQDKEREREKEIDPPETLGGRNNGRSDEYER